MSLLLIGLRGERGSGKDTVAGFLQAVDGIPWRRVAFADPLRQCAQIAFRLSDEQVIDPLLKEQVDPRWGLSPRTILQRLGTEVGRAIHPEVWIKNAQMHVEQHQAVGRHVVITDVRFRDEYAAVRAWGGVIWEVRRPAAAKADEASRHQSERELDGVPSDLVIRNDGTLADLRERVALELAELVRWIRA